MKIQPFKMTVRNFNNMKKLKITLALLTSFIFFSSCNFKSKDERETQLRFMFPKADIQNFDSDYIEGWNYIIRDTVNNRLILANTYRNSIDLIELPN